MPDDSLGTVSIGQHSKVISPPVAGTFTANEESNYSLRFQRDISVLPTPLVASFCKGSSCASIIRTPPDKARNSRATLRGLICFPALSLANGLHVLEGEVWLSNRASVCGDNAVSRARVGVRVRFWRRKGSNGCLGLCTLPASSASSLCRCSIGSCRRASSQTTSTLSPLTLTDGPRATDIPSKEFSPSLHKVSESSNALHR